MSNTRRQHYRFAAIFAGGTLFSRVLGLLRDMVLAALVPAASLNAFFLAFKLPNMLRDMLGEGAINAAFVPVLSATQEKESDRSFQDLTAAAMSAMLLVFGTLTVVGVLLMPLLPSVLAALEPLTRTAPRSPEELGTTVRLLQAAFPYFFFIGMAVFAMAPLFTMRHYTTPSWSPALLNLALIACCLAFYKAFPEPAWALVIGVWLGGIAQMVVLFVAMRRHTGVLLPSFQFGHPGLRRIFWLLVPVIFGQATGEVNKLVDSFFAYALPNNAVTTLFYANRLVQLPLSIFAIAVSVAILPTISRSAARGRTQEIRETLMHALRQTFFLVAPAMAGLLVLGLPIMRLLFERGEFDGVASERAATALFYYGLGLLSFAWVRVSVQGFYALQDTKTPVIVASVSMFVNILLNCALVGPLGFRGLALSTSISFTLNFVLLYVFLCNRFGPLWDRAFFAGLARMILPVLVMAAVAGGLYWRIEASLGNATLAVRAATALLPMLSAGAVYALLCWALRVEEFHEMLAALRKT